jgi:hypothetical protein
MSTLPERIAVVETKVDSLKEHMDANKKEIVGQIDDMKACNSREHAIVMSKLNDLTDFKNKWVWLGGAGLTILSLIFGHLETIIKIITH